MERAKASREDLEAKVLAAIRAEAGVDASGVQVEVSEVSGAVTLTGSIPTLEQHQAAGEVAASAEGVSIVHNHLRVVHEEDPTETHPPPRRKPQA